MRQTRGSALLGVVPFEGQRRARCLRRGRLCGCLGGAGGGPSDCGGGASDGDLALAT